MLSLNKLAEDIKLLKRGVKIVSKLEPYLITVRVIRALVNALTPFINIYMSGMILNELTGNRDLKTLIILVIITTGANFIIQMSEHGMNKIINFKWQAFGHKYEIDMSEKILSMDYDDVENPEIHNRKSRIDETGGGIWSIANSIENIMNNLLQIVFSVAITFNVFIKFSAEAHTGFLGFVNSYAYSILMVLIIVANVIFSMRNADVRVKKYYDIRKGMVQFNRYFNHYMYVYAGRYQTGKDIRLYNQKEFVGKRSMEHFDEIKKTAAKLEQNNIFYRNIDTITSVFISGIVYVFVGLKSLLGIFAIGSIVQYVGSINLFIKAFSAFMSSLSIMRSGTQALAAYLDFMDTPNKLYKGTLPVEKRDDNDYEIEFKNVSFKYPGTDVFVLKNLNLKFRIGQRLAVVGMNGSGKTTMIKLLCRLYVPNEGEITLNGFDINNYDYKEYMSIFSVVFQDFKLFAFPLSQNVAASVEYNSEKIEKCLNEAGFDERLKTLTNGIDTPLYKDFDENGVEISGGEAQKIALARALYKDAPFIVLDEPTAALDPIAEYEIYSKFNEIIGNKTAIFISHRLSSCRFCDDIAVFHEGELIQRGSHDSLIDDESGKYYELWHAQAQYYN